MSKLNDTIESIKTDINTAEETKPVETVEEKVETVPETSSETPKPETIETTQPVVENAPEAPETAPKPDLNNISDIDKATYSFKKQMQRQKSKYESDLADLRKQIEELKKPAEPKKFRDNFENDDQYMDYLVEQRVNKMMAERDKKDEERRKQEEEDSKRAAAIDSNIKECFKTEEEQKKYYDTVRKAFDDGLEDLMNQEQYVSNYIMNSKLGPKILMEMATNPELVNRIYSQPDAMSRIIEVKMYERDLLNKPAVEPVVTPIKPATVTTPAPVAVSAPVGKPGTSTTNTTDIFSDRNAMRNFLRRR